MMRPRNLLVVLCLLGLGCSSVRPLAQHGVDLLENTERSYSVRIAAAMGSMVGIIVAIPITVVMSPSYVFSDATGWGVREPTETEGTAAEGDYAIALAGVPFEYGMGMGSGIFAAPVAWIEDAIYGEPKSSEGWINEVQDANPNVELSDDTGGDVEQGPS